MQHYRTFPFALAELSCCFRWRQCMWIFWVTVTSTPRLKSRRSTRVPTCGICSKTSLSTWVLWVSAFWLFYVAAICLCLPFTDFVIVPTDCLAACSAICLAMHIPHLFFLNISWKSTFTLPLCKSSLCEICIILWSFSLFRKLDCWPFELKIGCLTYFIFAEGNVRQRISGFSTTFHLWARSLDGWTGLSRQDPYCGLFTQLWHSHSNFFDVCVSRDPSVRSQRHISCFN